MSSKVPAAQPPLSDRTSAAVVSRAASSSSTVGNTSNENIGANKAAATGMRTSCNFCGERKRKCDGQGDRDCTLCTKSRRMCTYSRKRRNWPRPNRPPTMEPIPQSNARREAMSIMPAHRAQAKSSSTRMTRQEQSDWAVLRGSDTIVSTAACEVWCGIAMPALLRALLLRSADECGVQTQAGLQCTFTATRVETSKMWMFYLCAFGGNKVNFDECMLHAKELVDKLATEGSQGVARATLVLFQKHVESMSVAAKDKPQLPEVKAFCSGSSRLLSQMHGPSTEDSSSSDIVGPFTRCGKVVIEALLARRPSAEEMGSPLAAGDEQDMIQWISHYDEGQDSASASTGVWPSVSGFSDSFIGEFRTELEQLELVLQRSQANKDMMDLLVNMSLGLVLSLQDDMNGAHARLSRSATLLVKQPRLCCMVVGVHLTHLILGALAFEGMQDLYDIVRNVYNPVRPAGSSPFPPLRGLEEIATYCNHMHCRELWEELSGRKRRGAESTLSSNSASEAVCRPVGGGESTARKAIVFDGERPDEGVGLRTTSASGGVYNYAEPWWHLLLSSPLREDAEGSRPNDVSRAPHQPLAENGYSSLAELLLLECSGSDCIDDGEDRCDPLAWIGNSLVGQDTAHSERVHTLLDLGDWRPSLGSPHV